jgi:putative lipoprotein (rSAM/lipoprotein system)
MKFRSLISSGLAVLLLASCNKASDGSDELAYIWFEVGGRVVDMGGMPVSGITVMAESAEPVTTDASGQFVVQGGGRPAESAIVQFADKDNAGKKYVSKSVTVELVKYKDGHGWNKGYYRNRETVVVALAEEAVITPPTSDVGTGQEE